ncbi:MAG: hypothetical protein DRH89_01735 [Candidatus Cloacimonadota bacterium]|nr:MAG: hypothetical protein DRH89_01735 [Candidatus Cloacimonadota bacterium]
MFRMKKLLLSIALLGITLLAIAADIRYDSDPDEFLIYNRRNSKIYNYFLLKPAENISCTLVNVDSLTVYSRVVINNGSEINYQYKARIGNEELILDKSAKLSDSTRGVNGESISSYNKYKTKIYEEKTNFSITNISQNNLIFKISGNNVVSSNKEIDYIRFTPNFYGDVKTLILDEKEYTYYTPKSDKIQLTLEGPIVLKIISRMLFDTNYINNSGYRFRVFDNRDFFAEFTEEAYKSKNSWVENEPDIIPSTGDVNIIKLPAGIHHLSIENKDKNKELIFRFYINKASVEIEK